jgi:hypothetical protein
MDNNIKTLKIYKIFQLIRKKFYNYRKLDNKFDGKGKWSQIKDILTEIDNRNEIEKRGIQFKKIQKEIYESIMILPEYNGYGIIETNHFLIQQVRIPNNETFSIRKLIQLGLNIGQWEAMSDKKIYKKIGYKNTNLNIITTYINMEDLKKLDELINKTDFKKIKKIIKNIDKEMNIEIK